MKFWKTTLAAALGVFLALIACTLLSLLIFSGLASVFSSTPTIPVEGVLRLDLSQMEIVEQTQEANPMETLQNGDIKSKIGILDAVFALEKAAADPSVKFLYLLPDGLSGGMAQIEELRKAVVNFKDSGKPVIAYTESPSTGGYYLASAADKVYMTSYQGGMTTITGLSSQLVFLKDLLDKLGVNVQLIRHGKYKSAGEMYIRNDISNENRQQYETFLGSIWNSISSSVAQSRGMDPEEFDALIDNLELNSPEDFLENGLVDGLCTREELYGRLADLYVTDDYRNVKFMEFADYTMLKVSTNYRSREKLAVIYADGEIIDGKEKKEVAGDRFAKIIAEVRRDSSVKAVVLRVNSPGGSVLASEKIKAEIELLRAAKPVIASYGSYAASGGYWISNSCDRIFSDASTLTGSIGVFSMIPEFSGTAKELAHVNVVTINSNRHSDMYGMMRPLDNREIAYMQESVDSIYEQFTGIVAEGRDLDRGFVDSIAQGRVWAGSDALGIGLVDEIGGLEDALRHAALVADSEKGSELQEWQIASYPKPLTLAEQFSEMLGMESGEDHLAKTPFKGIALAFKDIDKTVGGKVYARLPYAITIR